MVADDIFAEIRRIFLRYEGLLANFRAIKSRDNRSVSWREYGPHWVGAFTPYEDFLFLSERGQYSFQVAADGALFQLYYECDRRIPTKASLAFYRAYDSAGVPIDDGETSALESEGYDGTLPVTAEDRSRGAITEELLDPISSSVMSAPAVSWLRLDYDPRASRGLAHPSSHLHWSGFPDSRLPVRGIPTPEQFVDLVMMIAYPKELERHSLTDQGEIRDPEVHRERQRNNFPIGQAELLDLVTHIRIPVIE